MFECKRPLARELNLDHKANSIRHAIRKRAGRVLLRDPVHDCVIGIVAHRAIKQGPRRGWDVDHYERRCKQLGPAPSRSCESGVGHGRTFPHEFVADLGLRHLRGCRSLSCGTACPVSRTATPA
jgi:hypothetical protein